MIEAQIEIAASPSQVREVLLDFSKYPEWHTNFVKLLESEDNTRSLQSLEPGDKIKCDIDGMQFTAEIKENSDSLYQWQGPPVFGLIAGLHSFHMESANNGASTIFKQTEKFTGPISFLMTPTLLGRKMLGQYNQFNRDLKTRVEAMK
ncbi:hypothetical protein BO70DRAFT_426397 [Aspergillus heteromorphus CBS 117.55]|uniref:Polyketide cyclase/dehydrase n=1 Tax=Aspergillus heteromorphus CBS 117.55 TaxID=1448321 RepID=A0A317WXP2_9EURO|nr:uncharacterized protein BO70DRAFT_426397 [Aspergillus heteromorphus CBS 117.55]PWY89997.1 hypothetical protein BO70DRAFT_426397 [Aspergillus heteromorphus CBS 117.55]